jgi:hypothetical protein
MCFELPSLRLDWMRARLQAPFSNFEKGVVYQLEAGNGHHQIAAADNQIYYRHDSKELKRAVSLHDASLSTCLETMP